MEHRFKALSTEYALWLRNKNRILSYFSFEVKSQADYFCHSFNIIVVEPYIQFMRFNSFTLQGNFAL